MGAGFDPIGQKDGFTRGGGGNDDVGILCRRLAIGRCGYGKAKFTGAGGGTNFGLGHIACPDGGRCDAAHQFKRLELQFRLHTGPEDRGMFRVLARQMFGGNATGSGGADIGQITVIEHHGFEQAGFGRKQVHQSVDRWQAKLGIVKEAGADFDCETVQSRHIGGFDIDLAIVIVDIKPKDRRHPYILGRQCQKGVFDTGNRIAIKRDHVAKVGFGQNSDVGHIGYSAIRSTSSPPTIRLCKSISMLQPVDRTTVVPGLSINPARRAAMPTAAAPSITCWSS